MDPRLIQKQVKDNYEDLNVFMKDLKVWEKDMKRKERELLQNDTEPQEQPPIRGKKKKSKSIAKVVSETTTKLDDDTSVLAKPARTETTTPKKISGIDYAAWNSFDVDKACAEVDANESEDDESDSDDDDDIDSAQRLRDEATYEKEKGNQLVRKGNYADAIPCYSRAIECYPYDAIYYANRGLCYIKTNDFQSAEEDCTNSIKLDESYVKAYLRRATARIALGRFFEAKADFEKVLEFEPMNTDAKSELIKLEKTIKVSTPKKPDANISGSSSKSVTLEQGSGEPAIIKLKKPEAQKETISAEQQIGIDNKEEKQSVKITDVTNSETKIVELPNPTESAASPHGTKERPTLNVLPGKKALPATKVPASVNAANEVEIIPAKPKSSVDFLLGWRRVKSNANQSFVYLKQIEGSEIPIIFQESLESSILSEIITILKSEFLSRKEPVYQYLLGFSKVKRLSALTMFMSDTDKKGLTLLLDSSVSSKECSEEEAIILKQRFEL